mgnify:CR=1 FL=1
MHPWLSIVTVVRDDPEGLKRTLASVAAQEGAGSIEIVVVDSSADREASGALLPLVAGVASASCTWVHPRGVYPAMNEGLRLATGEWIYYLNAGDVLAAPDVLRRCREALIHEPEEWAVGSILIQSASGSLITPPSWDYDAEWTAYFARGRFPAHQGVIVRRVALEGVGGFDESYRICADYRTMLQLARRGRPIMLPMALAIFEHGGVSDTSWVAALKEFHRARREVLDLTGAARAREAAYSASVAAQQSAYRVAARVLGSRRG